MLESFTHTPHAKSTHTWTLQLHDTAIADANTLGSVLADRIIELQCRGAPHLFIAWRSRADGGGPLNIQTRLALEAFVAPAFGLPGSPAPLDHMEGFVAEHLWHALVFDGAAADGVVHLEPPSFRPTSPGGDGLVVHAHAGGGFSFRLWELKKCTGQQTVSGTISSAYRQLDASAAKYLAEYTAVGQRLDNPDLASFFSQLVELWLRSDARAAAGVAVHTSVVNLPGGQCFTTFGRRFPTFTNPVRLRGLVTAVDDFSAFAELVRDRVWAGVTP
jgi:hypothetical protein